MKKILHLFIALLMSTAIYAENFESTVDSTINLNEVSVTSLYRNNVNTGYLITHDKLVSDNHGQEPSHVFSFMPNIFSMSDNGTEFGYGYFRIRGLDQTRINVTLDGMPWNEAEDYGTYFANSPDLMSSLHSIKVERGTSSSNNGTASSGGSINLESIDLLKDTISYAYVGGGSYKTYKTSIIYNSGLFNKHHALHVKATQQQTDGFKDNSFNNSQAFTIKYGYFFNDRHNIEVLSLNGRHRNCQGWLGNTMDELRANKHANGNIKTEDDEWIQTINKIQYKGQLRDNVILTASTYLQYQNGWYNMDLDNYMNRMVDPAWIPTNILYSYGLTHYLYGGNVATKIYLDNLSITAGANAYAYDRNHFMADHGKNIPDIEYYDNTGHKNDVNAFLSASYILGKFNIGANAQYRHVDFRYHTAYYEFDRFAYDTNWNFINWGANVEYNFTNNMKAYARYSEVSREPTRTDMFGGNEYFTGNITTNKAERSHDVEVGYEVRSNKVKANVNLYYMAFTNERVLNGQYGLNGLPLHDTADKSYRMGVEGTVDWNFWKGFHYVMNGSLSKNKIDTETFNNKTHILTPAVTFNNEINYDGGNWTVGLNNKYRSNMYIDQANNYKVPYYLTFNIRGSYRYKKAEFGLYVNNILNRTNYYNAAEGATGLLWFREGGTNVFADVKYYF